MSIYVSKSGHCSYDCETPSKHCNYPHMMDLFLQKCCGWIETYHINGADYNTIYNIHHLILK